MDEWSYFAAILKIYFYFTESVSKLFNFNKFEFETWLSLQESVMTSYGKASYLKKTIASEFTKYISS